MPEKVASILEEARTIVGASGKSKGPRGLGAEKGQRIGWAVAGAFRKGAAEEQRGAHGRVYRSYREAE